MGCSDAKRVGDFAAVSSLEIGDKVTSTEVTSTEVTSTDGKMHSWSSLLSYEDNDLSSHRALSSGHHNDADRRHPLR